MSIVKKLLDMNVDVGKRDIFGKKGYDYLNEQ